MASGGYKWSRRADSEAKSTLKNDPEKHKLQILVASVYLIAGPLAIVKPVGLAALCCVSCVGGAHLLRIALVRPAA